MMNEKMMPPNAPLFGCQGGYFMALWIACLIGFGVIGLVVIRVLIEVC